MVVKRIERIERVDWVTREFVRANRDKVFLFGDNMARMGSAGQAKEMRGEPNAYGIPTKWYPGREMQHYFYDDEFDEVVEFIDKAFKAIPKNRTIIIPSNGIGTGLAKLHETAPRILEYIENKINSL